MSCANCGAISSGNASFCTSCGQPLDAAPSPPSFARPSMALATAAPAVAPVAVPATGHSSMMAAQDTRVFQVPLTRVTSFVIMSHKGTRMHRGTLAQLEQQSRSALLHNLLLGWWGFPFGIIWTIMALSRNSSSMRQIRQLAG